MNRRELLKTAAATLLCPRWSWADDLPADIKITRVLSFELPVKRSKFVGKNSRLGDHGSGSADRMARIYTSAGLEGIGICRTDQTRCTEILGRTLQDLYRPAERRMIGPLGRQTSPLWDLAGKVLKKPVYELLGGAGPKQVPVYDGSIYFIDLIPRHEHDWEDQFKKELDMGLERGHRAFKVKIGRGAKWMPRQEGDARDIAVLKLVRKHLGTRIIIGVDANDGYDLPRAKHFLAELPDCNLAFVEEIFPDNVEQYLELKEFIREHGWKTRIADGEGQRRPEDYKDWVEAKAVDILQGDMNSFGFEEILREATMGDPKDISIAPHNWGSLVGYYLQLHVGRAITNFYRAEQDPLSSPVLMAEGYEIKDGLSSVPAAPGLGLRLDESKFADGTKVLFDLKL